MLYVILSFLVFFFQAEDGIRDGHVTGVQTCALPISTVEVVMTILHAGGKFGGGGYAVSGGLHGVGVSVVNALSSRMVTEVCRNGYRWRQEFGEGGQPVGELQKLEATEETGTIQTFWADEGIFETTE